MTGPTHRQYSICFALVGAMVLFSHKMLVINYYVALPIMLMASKVGALFPDIDHDWRNVHDKTHLNHIINFIIHKTGGKHRSWQTHSIDILVLFTIGSIFGSRYLYTSGIFNKSDYYILLMELIGFILGWASHLFSDMLTSAGVRLLCFNKKKVALVPKKIFNLRFNTGNEWEKFNYKVMRGINLLLGIISLGYPTIYKNFIQ